MDWAKPSGKTIDLALIRIPVKDAKGTVFVNWGGPGAPGSSEMRTKGKPIQQATGGTMQIVSWDPRGLGKSTPINCPEGSEEFYNADPSTREGVDVMIAAVRKRAEACQQKYGDYLGLLGTTQGVQDLDAIRAAVGEQKLNFLGLSYGTRVGSVYAAMFPDRVGHMVLDGSLDPRSTLLSTAQGDVAAFEAALQEWFRTCAASPPCALGPDPQAGFDALLAKARRGEIAVPGTNHVLNAGLFNQVVLAALVNFGGSTAAVNKLLADYQSSGDPSGLYALALSASGVQADGTRTNAQEIFQFVNCQDWWDRPSSEEVHQAIDQAVASAPRVGAFAVAFSYLNSAGCPKPASGTPLPNKPSLPPVLVVGSTIDAETPFQWSQALSAELPNSVLLISQNFGHTAFYASPCVAQATGNALKDGVLPMQGTVCPPPA